jgi:hypothetical protein
LRSTSDTDPPLVAYERFCHRECAAVRTRGTIAAGQAVAIVSAGLRAGSLHPDLTTIFLDDVDPSHVVLATRADDRSRLVAAFRKHAQDCLTGSAASGTSH